MVNKGRIGTSISNSKRIGENNPMFGVHRYGIDSPDWKGGKRMDSNGYILILKPDHPSANSRGYVLEHRFVIEQFLGRYLLLKEIVHHINEIKDDNRLDNLMLFENKSEHIAIHHYLKGQNA